MFFVKEEWPVDRRTASLLAICGKPSRDAATAVRHRGVLLASGPVMADTLKAMLKLICWLIGHRFLVARGCRGSAHLCARCGQRPAGS
jgi:hypothetical protein